LQDSTVFLKKGHGDDETELFEFTRDEGIFFYLSQCFLPSPINLFLYQLTKVNVCCIEQSK
jgi:hypothetical protein